MDHFCILKVFDISVIWKATILIETRGTHFLKQLPGYCRIAAAPDHRANIELLNTSIRCACVELSGVVDVCHISHFRAQNGGLGKCSCDVIR